MHRPKPLPLSGHQSAVIYIRQPPAPTERPRGVRPVIDIFFLTLCFFASCSILYWVNNSSSQAGIFDARKRAVALFGEDSRSLRPALPERDTISPLKSTSRWLSVLVSSIQSQKGQLLAQLSFFLLALLSTYALGLQTSGSGLQAAMLLLFSPSFLIAMSRTSPLRTAHFALVTAIFASHLWAKENGAPGRYALSGLVLALAVAWNPLYVFCLATIVVFEILHFGAAAPFGELSARPVGKRASFLAWAATFTAVLALVFLLSGQTPRDGFASAVARAASSFSPRAPASSEPQNQGLLLLAAFPALLLAAPGLLLAPVGWTVLLRRSPQSGVFLFTWAVLAASAFLFAAAVFGAGIVTGPFCALVLLPVLSIGAAAVIDAVPMPARRVGFLVLLAASVLLAAAQIAKKPTLVSATIQKAEHIVPAQPEFPGFVGRQSITQDRICKQTIKILKKCRAVLAQEQVPPSTRTRLLTLMQRVEEQAHIGNYRKAYYLALDVQRIYNQIAPPKAKSRQTTKRTLP